MRFLYLLARLRMICWLAALCLLPSAATAYHNASPVIERAEFLLEPETGANLLALRERRDWAPYGDLLALGFGQRAYWLRLTVHLAGRTDPLVIRLRPSFLDDVRLYLPQHNAEYALVQLGDHAGQPEHASPDAALAVDWTPQASWETVELYIRIQTTSTRIAAVQVLSLSEAERKRAFENTIVGAFFGLMLGLLVWGAWMAAIERDAVFAWYVAYQFAALCMGAGLMGYVSLLWPTSQAWVDEWTSLGVLSTSGVGAWFHLVLLRSVFGPDQVPGSIRAVLLGYLSLVILNIALYLSGFRTAALAINANAVTAVACLLLVLVMWNGRRVADASQRPILRVYGLLLVVVLITLLPLTGMVPLASWMQFGTSIHALLVALVLATALNMRRAALLDAAREAKQSMLKERTRFEQASQERDEKDRFLSMLTHELRTPLSVIQMVLDGVRKRETEGAGLRQFALARMAVTDINRVIERTVEVDRLERRASLPRAELRDLVELASICLMAVDEQEAHRVEFKKPVAPVPVMIDAVLLRVILANLLDNALKYSPAGSSVTLTVEPSPQDGSTGPVLTISNWPGRAGRPDPTQIFTKFYRSEGARHTTGSGQGAYLMAGLARQLGLAVECNPGQEGDPASPVRFMVRWPA